MVWNLRKRSQVQVIVVRAGTRFNADARYDHNLRRSTVVYILKKPSNIIANSSSSSSSLADPSGDADDAVQGQEDQTLHVVRFAVAESRHVSIRSRL
jgi:hypothetical protein